MANNPFAQLNSAPAAVKSAKPERKTLTVKPGFNAKPDKNANQGANTGVMRTSLANPKPTPAPGSVLPSTAPAKAAGAPSQDSGLDMAMQAMANKLHPTGR